MFLGTGQPFGEKIDSLAHSVCHDTFQMDKRCKCKKKKGNTKTQNEIEVDT